MATPPNLSDLSKTEIKSGLDEVRLPFEVAIYSSENYFNFGAITRVAHNFLARKLWMVDFDKFYKKATMGTHKWETIAKVSLDEFLDQNKSRSIVAFERRSNLTTTDLRDFTWPDNPILFFGAEKWGVPQEVLNAAHSAVSIPVFGIHNDFNVSVAAGIAIYDLVSKTRLEVDG